MGKQERCFRSRGNERGQRFAETFGNGCADPDGILFVVGCMNDSLAVQSCDEIGAVVREKQFDLLVSVAHEIAEMPHQRVEPLARVDRDKKSVGMGVSQHRPGHRILDAVDLVEDRDGLLGVGAQFHEDLHRRVVKLENARMGGVQKVDEEVCHDGLLQRRIEGLDQLVGELADEADGIGHQERLLVRQVDLAGGRVERGEEGVLDEDVRAGESPQEGGLAGVRVADDRDIGDGGPLAVLALVGAVPSNLHEVALQAVHLAADLPLVLLELALALALRADAAALLAEVAPCACEARQRIGHAGEIDLDLGLAGLGA